MPNTEKPKRHDQSENEFYMVVREFYWRLFIHLMTPPLILGFIFLIPVILLSNQPDRLNAQCTVYDGGVGVRIISQTQRSNTTSYYWTDNYGDSWHIVHSEELPYQPANADCGQVQFDLHATTISLDTLRIHISPDGEVRQ